MIAKPITNERALILGDSLVIADLHIGIEIQYMHDGINIGPQCDFFKLKIINLLNTHELNKLIIVGDLKHKLFGVSKYEYKKITEFINELIKYCEINLIIGNHDSGIKLILPQDIKIYNYLQINDFFLTHGHRNPILNNKKIIIGHNHPMVLFKYEDGKKYYEPCWLKSKNLIVMPAFNHLCGYPITNRSELFKPMNKFYKISDLDIHLLNGLQCKVSDFQYL